MQFSKAGSVCLTIVLAAMLLSLPFLLPSGQVTPEANAAYLDEAYSRGEETAGMATPSVASFSLVGKTWQPVGVRASAAMSDILPAGNIAALPVDNSPGRTPIASGFTESGYRDDTIIVELEQLRMHDSDVYVAYVKIATPSQLRTANAGGKIGSNRTSQTTKIARNYNGIVAINGDMYAKNAKAGFIYRQGEKYMEKGANGIDIMIIDQLGDFHIFLRGKADQEEAMAAYLEEYEAVNGLFFGPALVKDGQVLEIPKDYQWNPFSNEPRAAIGQTGALTYVMVVVNGRTDTSEGVTLPELAEIMGNLGCKQAYNLDGGNSATLAFNGQVYNDKPQSERDVEDIIYFATATDGE